MSALLPVMAAVDIGFIASPGHNVLARAIDDSIARASQEVLALLSICILKTATWRSSVESQSASSTIRECGAR